MSTSHKSKRAATRTTESDATSTTKSATAKDTPELTNLQMLALDMAADLILNGGDHDDLEALLSGALRHGRTIFKGLSDWERANESFERELGEWCRDLMHQWPESQKAKDEAGKTISGQLRASVRGGLRSLFKWFLCEARMHEVYLLRDVLQTFESTNHGPGSEEAESLLAGAFASELGADHTYIKVPQKHINRVEDFMALLTPQREEDED